MLSPKKSDQERAVDLLLKTKDRGKAWLKGGWKDEPDAEMLGRDIGLGEDEGIDGVADGFQSDVEGDNWVKKGLLGMEKVTEGLGVYGERGWVCIEWGLMDHLFDGWDTCRRDVTFRHYSKLFRLPILHEELACFARAQRSHIVTFCLYQSCYFQYISPY